MRLRGSASACAVTVPVLAAVRPVLRPAMAGCRRASFARYDGEVGMRVGMHSHDSREQQADRAGKETVRRRPALLGLCGTILLLLSCPLPLDQAMVIHVEDRVAPSIEILSPAGYILHGRRSGSREGR